MSLVQLQLDARKGSAALLVGQSSSHLAEIEKLIRNENPRMYYHLYGELGRGGFGTV